MINNAITISDIHLEWDTKLKDFSTVIPEKMADAVFLNGDIAGGKHALPFIEYLTELGYKVFYVLGNHEFYGENFKDLIQFWNNVELDNFYFMHQRDIVVDNIRVIGAPLWASLGTLNLHPVMGIQQNPEIDWFLRQHLKNFADFNQIPNFKMTDMANLFWQDYRFIEKALEEENEMTTIVMTHHLPSIDSVPERFKNNKSSHAFYSEISHLMEEHKIDFWLHGHTHDSCDYQCHNTRVICNPRGYKEANQVNSKFEWLKIIDF
jgi:Icc-related predicted phosphoesterase